MAAENALYFITGSSGSGKTTLLNRVMANEEPGLNLVHLDDLGVPSIEEMDEVYGGPEGWQAHLIREWVIRAVRQDPPGLMIVEGQARPQVILEAAREVGLAHLHITLIDCSHKARRGRLNVDRGQPELDHLDTYAWAAYLRGQADALGLEIIDTTDVSPEEGARQLAESIRRFAGGGVEEL